MRFWLPKITCGTKYIASRIILAFLIYTSSPYPLQQELELLQEEGCKAFFEDGGCGLQETHRAAITAKLSLLRDSSWILHTHTAYCISRSTDIKQVLQLQQNSLCRVYIYTYLSNFGQIHLNPVFKTDVWFSHSYRHFHKSIIFVTFCMYFQRQVNLANKYSIIMWWGCFY